MQSKFQCNFIKSHTCQNTFIAINALDLNKYHLTENDIKNICNNKTGVSADQAIIYSINEKCIKTQFYNSDGSKAKMCGNGTIALAHILNSKGYEISQYDFIITNKKIDIKYNQESQSYTLSINTLKYESYFQHINSQSNQNTSLIQNDEILNSTYYVNCINNHFIHIANDKLLNNEDYDKIFNKIPYNINKQDIQHNYNKHIAKISSKHQNEIYVITNEYGTGPTSSCGSGEISCAYLAYSLGIIKNECKIISHGGLGFIKINKDNSIELTKKSQIICEGQICIK